MSGAQEKLSTLGSADWLKIAIVVILLVLAWIFGASKEGLVAVLHGAASAFTVLAVLFLGGLAVLIIAKIANGSIDLTYLIADQDGYTSLSRFQMLLFTFVVAGLYFLYALYALFQSQNGAACSAGLSDQIAATTGAINDALTAANTLSAPNTMTAGGADKATQVIAAATRAKSATDSLSSACFALSLPGIPSTVLGLIGISGGSYLLSKGIQAAATQGSNSGSANGAAGNPAPDQNPAPPSVRRNVNQ